MNKLKTYRNYLLINKILDLIIYLFIFISATIFSFMTYYSTRNFIILFAMIILIYIIGLFIARNLKISILLPTIIYLLISIFLISFIYYYESNNTTTGLNEFILISTMFLFFIFLIITIYKYETPISIYYRLKDYSNAVTFSRKIKTKFIDNKNPNTINSYSINLLFEKTKLLHKLNEEYKIEYNIIEQEYFKQLKKQKNAENELQDLERRLENIEQRLKRKNTGAQEYELCTQKKNLKEEIIKQNEITTKYNIIVNDLQKRKIELKDTYEKNQYYISNGYNIRYINYTNTIKEKLSLTNFKLIIVPFNSINKNLEVNNETVTN